LSLTVVGNETDESQDESIQLEDDDTVQMLIEKLRFVLVRLNQY